MGVVLPIAIFGGIGDSLGQVVGTLIKSVIVAAIWTTYLSKSKRVKNTYGRTVDTIPGVSEPHGTARVSPTMSRSTEKAIAWTLLLLIFLLFVVVVVPQIISQAMSR